MTDENEAVSTSRLNFGGEVEATDETPVAVETVEPTEPFTPPAFLTGGVKVEAEQPQEAVQSVEEATDVAEAVAEEVVAQPVQDGSIADVAQEVAQRRVEDLEAIKEPLVVNDHVVDEAIPEVNIELQEDDTIENLRAEQDRINARVAATEKAQKDAVLAEIKRVADTYKISVEEIIEAFGGLTKKSKAFGSKAKMKYRDPVSGKEWSGRGKAPLWIKDKNKDDFLITA